MPLVDREREINGKAVFLEACDARNGFYEMDFTQRRTQNGPGYSRKGEKTTDFGLDADAGFGEQAAAVWSQKGYFAVQYNHYGVRPSSIRNYLQRFLESDASSSGRALLSLNPVLDNMAFARLVRSEKQTRLLCTVEASTVTQEMADSDVALGVVQRLSEQTSAGRVEFSVSLGKNKKKHGLRNIRELVENLLGVNNSESVSNLKVWIKDDLDGTTEVLDLLEHRETALVPDNQLKVTSGRRFDYSSRIHALREEFKKWLSKR